MLFTILLVIFSLLALITLHELGHFLFARKFGVKVEEFGIGLPPRIWGKKRGDTIYSINLIPFGAFVKIYGEDGGSESDSKSFTSKPIWQRAIIIAAGVISFWLVAVAIYSFVFLTGAIEQIDDNDSADNAKVLVVSVLPESPAAAAGLQMGDIIKSVRLKSGGDTVNIDKVGQMQELADKYKDQEIVLGIDRANNAAETSVTPHANPSDGKGVIGIMLMRSAQKKYVWYEAVGNGFRATWNMTIGVFEGWGEIIGRLVKKEGMPQGAQVVGPIGIMDMMVKQAQMGAGYYLQFLAMLSVYLAVFNALPIPALDGGRLVFLLVEALRRKPAPLNVEQNLNGAFFLILIGLALIITAQDIWRIVHSLF